MPVCVSNFERINFCTPNACTTLHAHFHALAQYMWRKPETNAMWKPVWRGNPAPLPDNPANIATRTASFGKNPTNCREIGLTPSLYRIFTMRP